jgi:hypothetical protein
MILLVLASSMDLHANLQLLGDDELLRQLVCETVVGDFLEDIGQVGTMLKHHEFYAEYYLEQRML